MTKIFSFAILSFFTRYSVLGTRYWNGVEGADFGEGGELVFAQLRDAAREVVDGVEGAEAAFADQRLGGGFAQSANVIEAEAHGEVRSTEYRVPSTE